MTTYQQTRAMAHNVQELDSLWRLSCSWWLSRLQGYLAHPASVCCRAMLSDAQRERWIEAQTTRMMPALRDTTALQLPIIPRRPH